MKFKKLLGNFIFVRNQKSEVEKEKSRSRSLEISRQNNRRTMSRHVEY